MSCRPGDLVECPAQVFHLLRLQWPTFRGQEIRPRRVKILRRQKLLSSACERSTSLLLRIQGVANVALCAGLHVIKSFTRSAPLKALLPFAKDKNILSHRQLLAEFCPAEWALAGPKVRS